MKGEISPEATPTTKGGSLAANSLESTAGEVPLHHHQESTESQGRAAMLRGRSDDRWLSM